MLNTSTIRWNTFKSIQCNAFSYSIICCFSFIYSRYMIICIKCRAELKKTKKPRVGNSFSKRNLTIFYFFNRPLSLSPEIRHPSSCLSPLIRILNCEVQICVPGSYSLCFRVEHFPCVAQLNIISSNQFNSLCFQPLGLPHLK